MLCIDETSDRKKGKTSDYIAHQYFGNLGKLENGIVSVNAYVILDQIIFPLLFKVFKPRTRLKPRDSYKTKSALAVEIIFGQRMPIRYYHLTTDPKMLPPEDTWYIMTNLEGKI